MLILYIPEQKRLSITKANGLKCRVILNNGVFSKSLPGPFANGGLRRKQRREVSRELIMVRFENEL